MVIPAQEAAGTLRDIERAGRRSAEFFHDRRASPYLILFGVMWAAGYTASYLWPKGWLAWFVVIPVGKVVASRWISTRQAGNEHNVGDWKFWATPAAAFLFIVGVYAMLPPQTSAQSAALFPMLIALWYTLAGIWRGTMRMGAIGLALGLLTVGGYIWLQPYFLMWLAGVGGGALILGGTWLQRT